MRLRELLRAGFARSCVRRGWLANGALMACVSAGCAPRDATTAEPKPAVAVAPHAPAAVEAASFEDDATMAEAEATPNGAPAESVERLVAIARACWHDNEGDLKPELALSVSLAVYVGPPRSIVVAQAARTYTAFTKCVVARSAESTLEPGGDGWVRAKAALGPPS